MANRTLATIISLKDQFTQPAKKMAASTNGINREIKKTTNSIKRFGRNIKNMAINAAKNTAKIGTAFAGLAVSMAGKIGFTEAMNLEGYKTQLETATKDTVKAGQIMSWAVQKANSTPFETGSMVEASAKLEAMGLSAQKYIPYIADMAGATNKSLDQANEAIIDAQAGELERLKEFGITKQMIIDHGAKIMKDKQLVNNRGQITDQEAFNQVLLDLMDSKFKGGAEKQAKTLKGMWSTVTGITKTSLSTIMGIQEDGTIKQGSLYELLKTKISSVGNVLLKWQSDGTIKKIANTSVKYINKMIEIFKSVFEKASGIYDFFRDNFSTIGPIIGTIITAMYTYKAVMIASAIYSKALAIAETVKAGAMAAGTGTVNLMTIAQWAWNAAMTANPIGVVITLIAALVAVVIVAYNKCETFRKIINRVWEWIKKLAGSIKPLWELLKSTSITIAIGYFETYKAIILGVVGAVNSLWDGITNLFGAVKSLWETFSMDPLGFIIEKLQALKDKVFGLLDPLKKAGGWIKKIFGGGDKEINVQTTETGVTLTGAKEKPKRNMPGAPMRQYANGGIATKPSIFGEAGPEIAIPLENTQRSQILLNQASNIINPQSNNQTQSGSNQTIHIHLGAVYGFNDFKEKIAQAMYEISGLSGNVVVE